MKKLVSLLLTVCLLLSCCVSALAAENVQTKTLAFNSDGTFRLLLLSDYQDTDLCNRLSQDFLCRVLDETQPDLVVMDGDQLSELFVGATKKRVGRALDELLRPINDRRIPFLFTFGNHDHDMGKRVSETQQAAMYYAYDYCFAATDGCDPGTYSKPVYSADNQRVVFNIYMMDTNNKAAGSYDGVHTDQVAWYQQTSDALRDANGGEVIPSIVFQHIPVKEIYQLLSQVSKGSKGAYSNDSSLGDYYVLNESKLIQVPGCLPKLGEAPCSEPLNRNTGEYQAWIQQGDITLGAFFGHDHYNTFVGKSDDGITLGYAGGFGFKSYGNGQKRNVKLFTFYENDVENYDLKQIQYNDLTGVSATWLQRAGQSIQDGFWDVAIRVPAFFSRIRYSVSK